MYNNGLRTIAVFVSDMQDIYNRVICQHISLRAKELNYNVAILHWNNPYTPYEGYLKGEARIFDMFDYSTIDAAIYLKDIFNKEDVEKGIEERLDQYVDGPKVSIRLPMDGYYNILLNDIEGIRNIIKHLIEVHGLKRIAYMSGKKEMRDAKLRLSVYKEVMDEYNLQYDDSYIFHGDYWKEKGNEAVDYFLSSPLGVPEAIVCANDYMAFSVMDALAIRGYKIPDDMIVTGFDNYDNDRRYMPSLTTADVPLDVIGRMSVDIIDDVFCGRPRDMETYVDAVMTVGESCGCIDNDIWNKALKYMKNDNETGGKLLSRDIRLFCVALQDADNLDDLIYVTDNQMYINGNYNNFFLCLKKDFDLDEIRRFNMEAKEIGDSDKDMVCVLSMLNRANLFKEPFLFDSKTLIPPCYITEEPQIYYFSSIHYLEDVYGYTAINFYDYNGLQNDYYSFSINLGNALISLSKKQILERALRELEELYISDALTGLFNRRGFEFKAKQMFDECVANDVPFAFITMDMDGLKYINDTFGHMQGDIAICTLADAMKYASVGNEICARVGGDEFDVFARAYTKDDADLFISKIYEYLKQCNDAEGAQYTIDASYGVIAVSGSQEKHTFKYYMKLADVRMYQNKKKKRSGK